MTSGYMHTRRPVLICARFPKSPFKAQPCCFTACAFYGSWKITAAHVLGKKHTALPQNLVPNLLSFRLQNLNLLIFSCDVHISDLKLWLKVVVVIHIKKGMNFSKKKSGA